MTDQREKLIRDICSTIQAMWLDNPHLTAVEIFAHTAADTDEDLLSDLRDQYISLANHPAYKDT